MLTFAKLCLKDGRAFVLVGRESCLTDDLWWVAYHSAGGITFTIPLRIPQTSILFMYPSKSWNSSMVGLKTGIPR